MSGATGTAGETGSVLDRYPIKEGVKVGAGAWIVGILLSYGLASIAGASAFFGLSVLDQSIIFYYMLHLWPIVLAPGSDGASVALILTPIAGGILLIGGYLVASRAESGGSAFKNGAAVAVGYAVLAILSFFLVFGPLADLLLQQATFELLLVLVFTGLLMPVVFGGLGGLIAGKLAN